MSANELKERTRSSYCYYLTYRTRWSDNDQYSHINNSVYFHLFDSIINTYLIIYCGLSPALRDAESHSRLIGLVASSHCQFFAPLSFPQVVELGLRVNRLGKSSVEYEVGVFVEGEDAVSAVGGYTHVFVEKESRRPPADGMGEELRDGLSRLVRSPAVLDNDKAKL